MRTIEDVYLLLGEVKGQVNLLVSQGGIQDDRHSALDTRVRSLESSPVLEPRVRALENRQHWYAGGAAAAGAVLTLIAKGLLPWR